MRQDVVRPSVLNLYGKHPNFLDSFAREGKWAFRKRNVGVDALNKSAVFQEVLELLDTDKSLQR